MRSWSLVRLGTGHVRRKLFFKLRFAREVADREARGEATAATDSLARHFAVPASDIADMESRLSTRDCSLDARVQKDGTTTHLDYLTSSDASPDERMSKEEERQLVSGAVSRAMHGLNEREHYIVQNRLMTEEPKTLQEIGNCFQVSRERARQIEGHVLNKFRAALVTNCGFDQAVA